MKKVIIIIACLVLNQISAYAKHPLPEKYYQKKWCNEQKGMMEYKLPDGTRVDCLTDEYAVEFDFAPKWAESIGQSLYYANKTAKTPAIVLIIEKKNDFKYYYKIEKFCKDYGISLSYMEMPKNPENTDTSDNLFGDIIQFIINFVLELISQIIKIFS